MKHAFQLLFWLLFLTWTWLLVKPNPVPELVLKNLNWFDLIFIISKTVHLSVYAFFSLYANALTTSPRARAWVWGLMIAHGIATELGQLLGNVYFNTNRHGCIRDMIIDTVGVCVGVYAMNWCRRYWQRRQTNHESATNDAT